jgi:hypothetical protein
MAGQRDVEVRRRTLPLTYLLRVFRGNVSHPVKVRDGDKPSSGVNGMAFIAAVMGIGRMLLSIAARSRLTRLATIFPVMRV